MIESRLAYIFYYILSEKFEEGDRYKAACSLSDRVIPKSRLFFYIDNILRFYKERETFPSRDYFVETTGFKESFPDESLSLALPDVLDLIDQEIEFQRKLHLSSVVVDIVSDKDKNYFEVLESLREEVEKQEVVTGKYYEPPPILQVYEDSLNRPLGALTFINQIDEKLMGLEPGNVMTIGAFVSQFKTTMGINIAYNNAVKAGYNVAYLTLEVPRDYVRYMLLSRHSMNPKFGGSPVPYSTLKMKDVTPEQKSFLKEVDEDFQTNKDYGRVFVLELFDFQNISYGGMRSFLSTLPVPIDILVVDYIQLFQYVQDRSFRLDNVTSMIDFFVRQFAMLAQNFNKRKVSVFLLSQTNREGFKRAKENNGRYDLMALSEARELERSSYSVMFLYTTEEMKAAGEVKVSMPKNRGGETIEEPFITSVDPRFCVIGDELNRGKESSVDYSGLLSGGFGFGG